MLNPRLAGRYAKSLVDLAVEQNMLEVVYTDMKYLRDLCKQSKDFTNLLRSPIINGEIKEKIVKTILENKIGKLTFSFIDLLVKKGREQSLPEIAYSVIAQYNEIKGIHIVKLTTATPTSEELKQAIVTKVQTDTKLQKIELETVVDESLIGGYQLDYKGNFVDASIARDLRDIKKQFQKNIYIRNIR
jgi:F-type H+-transporting ATPase subunit delta